MKWTPSLMGKKGGKSKSQAKLKALAEAREALAKIRLLATKLPSSSE